jgi:hypothetical protein
MSKLIEVLEEELGLRRWGWRPDSDYVRAAQEALDEARQLQEYVAAMVDVLKEAESALDDWRVEAGEVFTEEDAERAFVIYRKITTVLDAHAEGRRPALYE